MTLIKLTMAHSGDPIWFTKTSIVCFWPFNGKMCVETVTGHDPVAVSETAERIEELFND